MWLKIMDESEFLNIAQNFLNDLAEQIEAADTNYDLNTEYSDGVLEIDTEGKGVYVLNVHRPTQKIWYSSPFSGADYFSYQEQKWLNKTAGNLFDILATELAENLKIKLA